MLVGASKKSVDVHLGKLRRELDAVLEKAGIYKPKTKFKRPSEEEERVQAEAAARMPHASMDWERIWPQWSTESKPQRLSRVRSKQAYRTSDPER